MPAALRSADDGSQRVATVVAAAAFLAVRFALELAMLFAFGYWAASLPLLTPVRILVGIAAVGAAAAVWGIFVAPRARVRLRENARLSIELCIVAAAVAAVRATGRVQAALALGVAGVVVAIVNSLWLRRRRSARVETAS
jgi:hypothetical protein